MSKHFKAWVRDLKTDTQRLHESSDIVVYTDRAFHHADSCASYTVCALLHSTWSNYTDWCPATSSFDAEICAIKKAIKTITSSNVPHAHLFCDNKAAANAMFNSDVKSNQMTILWINYLLHDWLASNNNNELHVRFVPSHLGIEGNE